MDAPSVRFNVGRATLTMVLSTTTRKTERQRTGNTIQRRSAEAADPADPLDGDAPPTGGMTLISTADPDIDGSFCAEGN
jgi:hypothetical protein